MRGRSGESFSSQRSIASLVNPNFPDSKPILVIFFIFPLNFFFDLAKFAINIGIRKRWFQEKFIQKKKREKFTLPPIENS
jgi:hypothetical protein